MQLILEGTPEFVKHESGSLAFNQLIANYSFTEKQAIVVAKHLSLLTLLVDLSSYYRLENTDKVIAFCLDKYTDSKFEQSCFSVYTKLLTKNNNDDFHKTLCLLFLKQGHFNPQTEKSHNHLAKRLKLLLRITSTLGEYLSSE